MLFPGYSYCFTTSLTPPQKPQRTVLQLRVCVVAVGILWASVTAAERCLSLAEPQLPCGSKLSGSGVDALCPVGAVLAGYRV